MGEKEKWREEGTDTGRESFSNIKEIERTYDVLSILFFKKSQKYILVERNWAQIQCNRSIFRTKMSGAFLPLEELFKSLKPVSSNYLE